VLSGLSALTLNIEWLPKLVGLAHSGVTSHKRGINAMTDLELLSRRLQTLENRFRRIKIIAVLACIVISALLLM
jgi:hypothetical protein